ncbi:hypothetical protein BKA70DRAFT_1579019 [Coprinopsis sp. MPI-PUGE-AT-0042]|nr:hypothetical protein BKA70DRAFT_1579019 [Coprinopsis sp. MPI-PUGE-AT-0042]
MNANVPATVTSSTAPSDHAAAVFNSPLKPAAAEVQAKATSGGQETPVAGGASSITTPRTIAIPTLSTTIPSATSVAQTNNPPSSAILPPTTGPAAAIPASVTSSTVTMNSSSTPSISAAAAAAHTPTATAPTTPSSRPTPNASASASRRPTRAGGKNEPLVRLGTPSRFSPLHVEVQTGPSVIAPGGGTESPAPMASLGDNAVPATATTVAGTNGSAGPASGGAPVAQAGIVVVQAPLQDPSKPWKHPDELEYICRQDWPQEVMITYLRQNVFSIPPSEKKLSAPLSYSTSSSTTAGESPTSTSSLPLSQPYPPVLIPNLSKDPRLARTFTEIACPDGTTTLLPKGYRVPLMFVAKFLWESLRLVLTSVNPDGEWEEFRFDIVHLSRLSSHLLKAARTATTPSSLSGPPHISAKGDRVGTMDRAWRCGLFDRALTRFYRRWMICREWSVKLFFEEFGEEEYAVDVLKYDWPRWVLKGHKGFVLTKEEVDSGISAEQFTAGLDQRESGQWYWDNEAFTKARIHRPLPLLVAGPVADGGDGGGEEQPMSISAAPGGGGGTNGNGKRKRSVEVKQEMVEQSLRAAELEEEMQPGDDQVEVTYTPIVPTATTATIDLNANSATSPAVSTAPVMDHPGPAAPVPVPSTPAPLSIVSVNTSTTLATTPPAPQATISLQTAKENQTLPSKENQTAKEKAKETTVLAGTKRGRDEVDDESRRDVGDRNGVAMAPDLEVLAAVTKEKEKQGEEEGRAAKKAKAGSTATKHAPAIETNVAISTPPTTIPVSLEGGPESTRVMQHPGLSTADPPHVKAAHLAAVRVRRVVFEAEKEKREKENLGQEEREREVGKEAGTEKERDSGEGGGERMDVDGGVDVDMEKDVTGNQDKAVSKDKETTAPAEDPSASTSVITAQDATGTTDTPPAVANTRTSRTPTPKPTASTSTTPKPPRTTSHLSATQQLLAKPARRDSSSESNGSGASGAKGSPPPSTPVAASSSFVFGPTSASVGAGDVPVAPAAPAEAPPNAPAASASPRGQTGTTPRRLGPASRNLMGGSRPRLAINSPKVGGSGANGNTTVARGGRGELNGTEKGGNGGRTSISTISTMVSAQTALSQSDREGLSALESVLSATVGGHLGDAVKKILETLSKVIRDHQRVVLERLPSTGGVVATSENGTKSILDPETAKILEALLGLLEGNQRIAGMVEASHADSTESFGEIKALLEDVKGRMERIEQSQADSTSSVSQLVASQTELSKRSEGQNAEVVKMAGAIQGSMKTTAESLGSLQKDVESVSEKVERVIDVVSQGLEGLRDDVKRLGDRLKGLEARPVAVQSLPPPPPSASAQKKSKRVASRGSHIEEVEEEEDESTPAPAKKGNPVLVRKVMDVMRNMADILEYSDESSTSSQPMSTALTVVAPSSKGKEKAASNSATTHSGYGDMALTQAGGSVLFSAILDEMRGIRDELRTNDKRGREELATLRLLHGAEMETIRRNVRDSEESARRDTQRWIDERLEVMIQDRLGRTSSSNGANGSGGSNANTELVELRRRLEYLESKQRPEVDSPATSASPVERRRERSSSIASSSNDMSMKDIEVPTPVPTPSITHGSNAASTSAKGQTQTPRDWDQPPPVPIRHLNGFGSGIRAGPYHGGSASAGPSRKASTSSLQGATDGISTPPLPVKSQRKAMMALARQPPAE